MTLQNQYGFLLLVRIRFLNDNIFFSTKKKSPFQLLQILPASSVQGDLESDVTVLLYHMVIFGNGHCCQDVPMGLRGALLDLHFQALAFVVFHWTSTMPLCILESLGIVSLLLETRRFLCGKVHSPIEAALLSPSKHKFLLYSSLRTVIANSPTLYIKERTQGPY